MTYAYTKRPLGGRTGFSLVIPPDPEEDPLTLISRYSLDADGTRTAGTGGPNGSIIGTAVAMDTLNDGDAGGSLYFGPNVYMTWAADAAHELTEFTLDFFVTFKTFPASGHVTLLSARGASGTSSSAGAFSLCEVNSSGHWRGYKYDDSSPAVIRRWNNTDAFSSASPFVIGVTKRVTWIVTTSGSRLLFDGVEVATADGANSWANQTKYIGGFLTGGGSVVGIPDAAFDRISLYDRAATAEEIAEFPAPVNADFPGAPDPGEPANIVTTAIYVWGKEVENANGDRDWVGERQITDTATGGTIASASGGTLPAFPIDIDPTAYVSGAAGSKSAWSAQFQNTNTAIGSWARLGSGNFRFTPSTTAGIDTSEYRISDDGGTSWSPWATLETRVIARSLTPGPYFLVEDYAGTSNAKLDAARNAATAAGGGTVTTLLRSTVLTDVTDRLYVPRVHYLGLSVRKSASLRLGVGCSFTSPNGQCSGWSNGFFSRMFNGINNRTAIANSGVRINMSCCSIDGNMYQQTLHQSGGQSATPNKPCGTCWPGNQFNPDGRHNNDVFNLQQSANIIVQGKSGPLVADRALYGFYGCLNFNCVADGLRIVGAGDVESFDCIYDECFRGGIVADGGNTKLRTARSAYLTSPVTLIGCGIDHEVLLGETTTHFTDYVQDDDFCQQDFDISIRGSGSTANPSAGIMTFRGVTAGPGMAIWAQSCDGGQFNYLASPTTGKRGQIRYHRNGGESSTSVRPYHHIGGWAGFAPHALTSVIENTDFIAWWRDYIFHGQWRRPVNGPWEFGIGLTVSGATAFHVTLRNCTASLQPGFPGGKTVRLLMTQKVLSTAQTVTLDGLVIGNGFVRDACVMKMQTLRYRNVSHLGFPGATIQQICPGAGAYVAL